jgi:hypothetical protein
LKIQDVNQVLTIISRVVVHPKYRTIGLGQKIVKESLPQSPTRYTETIAVMARYNPFFERAGMLKVCEKTIEPKVLNFLNELKKIAYDTQYVTSRGYTLRFFREHPGRFEEIQKMMTLFHHVSYNKIIGHRMVMTEYRAWIMAATQEQIANLMHHIGVMATNKVYLIFDKEWLAHPELRKLPERAELKVVERKVTALKVKSVIKKENRQTFCGYSGNCAYKDAIAQICAMQKGKCRDQKEEAQLNEK